MKEASQITSLELAREFSNDSAHVKRDHSVVPVTMQSLREVSDAYFRTHPGARSIVIKSPEKINPAPTPDEVQTGAYILNKLTRIR